MSQITETTEIAEITSQLDSLFNNILANEMAGLPLLNPKINVEVLGFQEFEGRTIGIVISPWLMSLIMLPSSQLADDWSMFEIGQQHVHTFPSGDYKFLVNEFEGIGICQVHAIHSPMSNFFTHDQAKITALIFMKKLMTVVDEDDRLDERRLERFINGENMDDIQKSEQVQEDLPETSPEKIKKPTPEIARRDFLRGRLEDNQQA